MATRQACLSPVEAQKRLKPLTKRRAKKKPQTVGVFDATADMMLQQTVAAGTEEP